METLAPRLFIVLLPFATTIACGGGSSTTGATCNPCDDGGSNAMQAKATNSNPDGIPYPKPPGGYGRSARSGKTPGSVMANFKFFGFPHGDTSHGLQVVALADYFDPMNKRYKVLRINAAAVWCPPCNQETDAIVAAKTKLDAEGVVILQTLFDGPTKGVSATENDLVHWIQKHASNFDSVLDPGLQNLGGFFNSDAIPWNADLDVRSMEILDQSLGWNGDILSDVQPALSWVSSNPPTAD